MRRCSRLPLVRGSTFTATSCTPPRSALYTRPCGPATGSWIDCSNVRGRQWLCRQLYLDADAGGCSHHARPSTIIGMPQGWQHAYLRPATRACHLHGGRSRGPPRQPSTLAPAALLRLRPYMKRCSRCCRPAPERCSRCRCCCCLFACLDNAAWRVCHDGGGAGRTLRSNACHWLRHLCQVLGTDACLERRMYVRHCCAKHAGSQSHRAAAVALT